jgi:hypothetical protein
MFFQKFRKVSLKNLSPEAKGLGNLWRCETIWTFWDNSSEDYDQRG